MSFVEEIALPLQQLDINGDPDAKSITGVPERLETTILAVHVPGGLLLAFDRRETIVHTLPNGKKFKTCHETTEKLKWEELGRGLHVLNAGSAVLVEACRRILKRHVAELNGPGSMAYIQNLRRQVFDSRKNKVDDGEEMGSLYLTVRHLVFCLRSQPYRVYNPKNADILLAGIENGVPKIVVITKHAAEGTKVPRVTYKYKNMHVCLGSGFDYAEALLGNFKADTVKEYCVRVMMAMLDASLDSSTGERITVKFMSNTGRCHPVFDGTVREASDMLECKLGVSLAGRRRVADPELEFVIRNRFIGRLGNWGRYVYFS